jgi:hypothetical protein
MACVGPISSVFDVTTFAVVWFVMGASTVARQGVFQSGWFIVFRPRSLSCARVRMNLDSTARDGVSAVSRERHSGRQMAPEATT